MCLLSKKKCIFHFLLYFFLLLFSDIYGQDKPEKAKLSGIGISYYSENISHYGLKIVTEFPLLTKHRVKEKNNGKTIYKQTDFFITGYIGSYIHKRNHIAVFAGNEIGYRKTRRKGFKYEFLLGLGYLHTFLEGDTYKVDDNGDIKKVNFAGQPNLMIPFSFGFGYDFNFFFKKPICISIKPGFFIQYPYNIAIAGRPTIDFGMYYYF